jgi:hypothetical protein
MALMGYAALSVLKTTTFSTPAWIAADEKVLRPKHIRTDRLHGMKLARGDLLQGRRVEHVVHALHGIL